jgi:hypothetical protein
VSSPEERASPRPSVRRRWWVRAASATRAIELAAERVAGQHGLIAAYHRGAVVLCGGRQPAPAVLPEHELPTRARLQRGDTRDGFTLGQLQVEAALPQAVMDPQLQRRYADRLHRIARDLDAALAAVTEVYDVGHDPRADS